MKKLILVFLFLPLFATVTWAAKNTKPEPQEAINQTRHNGRMGFGIDLVTTNGFGVTMGVEATPWLHIRAGYNFLPFVVDSYEGKPIPFEIPGVVGGTAINTNIAANMDWHTGSLMLDLYPTKRSNFHFTLGLFGGTRDILSVGNTTRLPAEFDNAGFSYYINGDKSSIKNLYRINSQEGFLSFSLSRKNAIRPYVGMGWGSIIPEKRVGLTFDFGVEYTGGTGIFTQAKNIKGEWERINLSGEGLKSIYKDITGNEIDGAIVSAMDTFYEKVPILPYMKLSLVIKLF